MKNLFSFILLLGFTLSVSSQNVSEFKQIYVPVKFDDFKTNNAYNLNKILVSKLSDKRYSVTQEIPEQWPVEFAQNSCGVLSAQVLDVSSMFRNKVKLEFKDCEGRVVGSYETETRIKEFHEGFQDALLKAIAMVPGFSGTTDGVAVTATSIPSATQAKVVTEASEKQVVPAQSAAPAKSAVSSASEKSSEQVSTAQSSTVAVKATQSTTAPASVGENAAQEYAWNGTRFTKVNLSEDHFIFTRPQSSVPYAQFRATSQAGVYRVTLENSVSTLGFAQGNDIVIELPDGKGGFTKEVFKGL